MQNNEPFSIHKQVYEVIVRLAYQNQKSNPHYSLANIEEDRLKQELESTGIPQPACKTIIQQMKAWGKIDIKAQKNIEGKVQTFVIPKSPEW